MTKLAIFGATGVVANPLLQQLQGMQFPQGGNKWKRAKNEQTIIKSAVWMTFGWQITFLERFFGGMGSPMGGMPMQQQMDPNMAAMLYQQQLLQVFKTIKI